MRLTTPPRSPPPESEAAARALQGWTWRAAAAAEDAPAAAVAGGKIYVVGGIELGGDPQSSVDVFDPQTNSWAAGPAMGTARAGHAAAVVDGKIYVMGGLSGSTGGGLVNISSVEVFDPRTGSWAAGPTMGVARGSHAAAVCGR